MKSWIPREVIKLSVFSYTSVFTIAVLRSVKSLTLEGFLRKRQTRAPLNVRLNVSLTLRVSINLKWT